MGEHWRHGVHSWDSRSYWEVDLAEEAVAGGVAFGTASGTAGASEAGLDGMDWEPHYGSLGMETFHVSVGQGQQDLGHSVLVGALPVHIA